MSEADIRILRTQGSALMPVGRIAGSRASGFLFAYDSGYMDRPDAIPLSMSLPLGQKAFPESAFRPYFEGLLAEGEPRRRLCAEAGVREDDWLSLLAYCGRDCIGDVVAWDAAQDGAPPSKAIKASFTPVLPSELRAILGSSSGIAGSNSASRLSLAGTQDKLGLAHAPGAPWQDGWLRPQGLAPSTHILKSSELRDLPELEFICMRAASSCGIRCAETHLVSLGRAVTVISRFDRRVATDGGRIVEVERIHQEDLAQALGVSPASKYAEIPGGTIGAVARVLREQSINPLGSLAQLARVLLFNYLVGNCDAHLKNYSLSYEGGAAPVLTPAYDLVSTTYFERFSRDMAMALGRHRDIDEVDTEDFELLAADMGLGRAFVRRAASELVAAVPDALAGAASSPEAFESTPYIADDLIDEMGTRLEVLGRFADGA